jgi:hypothetical protein
MGSRAPQPDPGFFSEDFQDGQVLEGVRFATPFAGTFDVESWL